MRTAEGSFVISESAIMFWALMMILVVSVAVAVMGTVLMRPSQGKNVLTRLTDKLYAGYQHLLQMCRLFSRRFTS